MNRLKIGELSGWTTIPERGFRGFWKYLAFVIDL
jgi:hypothetical protein